MLFEEYLVVLLVMIIVVIEVWLRARQPRFHQVARISGKDATS